MKTPPEYFKPLTRAYSESELHRLIDLVLLDPGVGSLSNKTQDQLCHYLGSFRPKHQKPKP